MERRAITAGAVGGPANKCSESEYGCPAAKGRGQGMALRELSCGAEVRRPEARPATDCRGGEGRAREHLSPTPPSTRLGEPHTHTHTREQADILLGHRQTSSVWRALVWLVDWRSSARHAWPRNMTMTEQDRTDAAGTTSRSRSRSRSRKLMP